MKVGLMLLCCLSPIALAQEPTGLPPAPTVVTWKEPASYRGLAWGESIAEATDLLKDGFASETAYGSPCVCARDGKSRFCKALPEKDPKKTPQKRWCNTRFIAGAVRLKDTFHFDDDLFAAVNLEFRAEDYEALKAIFLERYGEPTERQDSVFKTKGGATANNEMLTWNGKVVAITLIRFGDSIDKGAAVLASRAHLERMLREAQENKAQGAKAF